MLGQLEIRTYTGGKQAATRTYQKDAIEMRNRGHIPISEKWSPGSYGAGAFRIALALCFILVGIPLLIYMLIVKPESTLTVTYAWLPPERAVGLTGLFEKAF